MNLNEKTIKLRKEKGSVVDKVYDYGVLKADFAFNKNFDQSISLQISLDDQMVNYMIVPDICFDDNGWSITE